MAEPATTGVAEPAAGLFRVRQFAFEVLHETLRHPQELNDSIPLGGCIQNYDSAYHIIFTNVKTIQQQFSSDMSASSPPVNDGAESGDGWPGGAHGVAVASWRPRGRGII
jgi:hypothetical protein